MNGHDDVAEYLWNDVSDNEVIELIRSVPCHFGDISVTAANVRRGADYQQSTGITGEAITAGQLVALDTSDGKVYLSDANSGTSQRRKITGIATHTVTAADQPITYQTAGYVNPGGTAAAGVTYCMSATAGGIALDSDITSGLTKSIFGVGYTASLIRMSIFNSEATV